MGIAVAAFFGLGARMVERAKRAVNGAMEGEVNVSGGNMRLALRGRRGLRAEAEMRTLRKEDLFRTALRLLLVRRPSLNGMREGCWVSTGSICISIPTRAAKGVTGRFKPIDPFFKGPLAPLLLRQYGATVKVGDGVLSN